MEIRFELWIYCSAKDDLSSASGVDTDEKVGTIRIQCSQVRCHSIYEVGGGGEKTTPHICIGPSSRVLDFSFVYLSLRSRAGPVENVSAFQVTAETMTAGWEKAHTHARTRTVYTPRQRCIPSFGCFLHKGEAAPL